MSKPEPRNAEPPAASSHWKNCHPLSTVARITREEFEGRFLGAPGELGCPAVVTDAMEGWACKDRWTFDFFRQRYGELTVDCWYRNSRARPYPAIGYRLEMSEYIEYSLYGDHSRPPPNSCSIGDAEFRDDTRMLYWFENIARPEFESLLEDFDPDLYFVDNLLCRLPGQWSRLPFYMPFTNLFLGGPNTNVALHKDYWSSHTMIAQIRGVKHAFLFPPTDRPWLFSEDGEPIDPRAPDPEKYPEWSRATPYVGHLNPGDMLFIPPNWYHDVVSETPSISLSMNFCTLKNFGEYFSNLLSHPLQIYDVLKRHPVLRNHVHDAKGRRGEEAEHGAAGP